MSGSKRLERLMVLRKEVSSLHAGRRHQGVLQMDDDKCRKLTIPCIEDVPALEVKCSNMGLRYCFQDQPGTPQECENHEENSGAKRKSPKKRKKAEYEVEVVLDIKIDENVEYYLVKWKGWLSPYNTWEPMTNLTNCPLLIKKFHQHMKDSLLSYSGEGSSEIDDSNPEVASDIVAQYISKRAEVKKRLKMWEADINAKLPCNHPPIEVENDVDLEGVPEKFNYICDYKAGEGVMMPTDPLIGWIPIYECNIRCKCGIDCCNRVVQQGSQVKMAIFRTSNGCGWGVKTLQDIAKNRFVMEYVGEIISTEEAENRGKVYDANGRTYLFDLDFEESDCPFTVDATNFGNIAHFMNHSCDPNLVVYGLPMNPILLVKKLNNCYANAAQVIVENTSAVND
ncbi:Eukaryotic translation initiation factor 2 subunit 3 [Chamberlinius hualienensis]